MMKRILLLLILSSLAVSTLAAGYSHSFGEIESGYRLNAKFNLLSLNPLQWLYQTSGTATVDDKTTNDIDANLVDSPCITLSGDDRGVFSSAMIPATDDFSISFFTATGSDVSSYQHYISQYVSGDAGRFQFLIYAGLIKVTIGGAGIVVVSTAVVANTTYKVELSRSGNNLFLTMNSGTPSVGEIPLANRSIYQTNTIIGSYQLAGGQSLTGQMWDFKIDGSTYNTMSEKGGVISYDAYDLGGDIAWIVGAGGQATLWANTQSNHNYAILNGYSLWEHATALDLYVPYGTDGLPLSIATPTGYTKTGDYPAIDWHNGAPTYTQQDDALLNDNAFWYSGGTFLKKTPAEFYAHNNFEDNVVVCAVSATEINNVITWEQSYDWTAGSYQRVVNWLTTQGSTVTNLVPAQVTAGTGIGPDLDWAYVGDKADGILAGFVTP